MDLKSWTDLGLSGAALGACIYVIVRLLDLFKSMNQTISKLAENITENTSATRKCTEQTILQTESQAELLAFLRKRK